MMPPRLILCVGVTPCIQRTIRFAHLDPGRVNRARSVTVGASAKGTNVCRVIRTLGGEPRLVTLLGGGTGDEFRQRIEAEGLPAEIVPSAGHTRICQTLIDESRGQVTELVEEAPTPSAAEWQALDQVLARCLPEAAAQLLSGRLPPGSPPDTYARWVRMANAAQVPTFVDSQQEALVRAVAERPFLVKINAEELVASYPGEGDAPAGIQYGIDRIRAAGVPWVLITHGARPAVLVGVDGAWRYRMPTLRAANPIGSGDATLAGAALAVQQGRPLREAARYGLACGCANALTDEPGHVRSDEVDALYDQIDTDEL